MAFGGRARNLLFFDFIHSHHWPYQELRLNEKAKEMVEDALAKREY